MKTTAKWVGAMLTGLTLFANYGESSAKALTFAQPAKVQKGTAQVKPAQPAKVQKEQPKVKAPESKVAYEEATGYFVKNTVKGPLANPKIETKKGFDEVFGPATTMGKNGKPTAINFDKKFVIGIVGDKTDKSTKLQPVSLEKEASGNLVLSYRKEVGIKQSATFVPTLVLLVDKAHTGKITLKEVK